MKKIILIIIVLVILIAVGGYFGWEYYQDTQLAAEIDTIEELQGEDIPDIDLSESGLNEVQVLEIDLDTDIEQDTITDIELSVEDTTLDAPDAKVDTPPIPSMTDLNFDFSSISLGPSGETAVPSSATGSQGPDDATCAQFASAPDCSYVPAEHQDLCAQCKGQ